MADKHQFLQTSRKILGYLGLLYLVRMCFKFLSLFGRMINFKKIPAKKNSKSVLQNPSSKRSHRNDRSYVIYNGINSSITNISIFLIQTKNVIEQVLKLGYSMVIICDRLNKQEVSQLITNIIIDLRIDEKKITLKTLRRFPLQNSTIDKERFKIYCRKKFKLLIKNKSYILFNNVSVWKRTAKTEEDNLNFSLLFNHFLYVSTIIIRIITENMLSNKGEHIIIGSIDKLITYHKPYLKNNDEFSYNRMSCKYFKNLHYVLRSENPHKIHVTFVKNINYIENIYLPSKEISDTKYQINKIDLKKINLNLSKNIQFNSSYALILYYTNNLILKF
jgi:hypothetical protein